MRMNKHGQIKMGAMLTGAMIGGLMWLVVTGVIGWSSQMTWILLIGAGIWLFARRR